MLVSPESLERDHFLSINSFFFTVDIYLNSLTKNELYYENYKMVSVMFAQLSNFQLDLCSLRILNEVITQFDVLVSDLDMVCGYGF